MTRLASSLPLLFLGALLLLSTAHATDEGDTNSTDRFGPLGCGRGCTCPKKLDCGKQSGCCWRESGSLRTGAGFGLCEVGISDKKGDCVFIREKSPSPPLPPPSPSPPYPPTGFSPTYPPTANCALLGQICNDKSFPCCSFQDFCSDKTGRCVSKLGCANIGEVCNPVSKPCCDGRDCSDILGLCL